MSTTQVQTDGPALATLTQAAGPIPNEVTLNWAEIQNDGPAFGSYLRTSRVIPSGANAGQSADAVAWASRAAFILKNDKPLVQQDLAKVSSLGDNVYGNEFVSPDPGPTPAAVNAYNTTHAYKFVSTQGPAIALAYVYAWFGIDGIVTYV